MKRSGHLAGQLLQPGVELVGERENALGVFQRHRSRGSERDAALRAVEQARVEVFFELPDLEGHRGLRHEQRLRSLGEGEMLCDRVKYPETPVCHDSSRVRPLR